MVRDLPQIYTSAAGLHRTRFHQEFDTVVVPFFRKTLN